MAFVWWARLSRLVVEGRGRRRLPVRRRGSIKGRRQVFGVRLVASGDLLQQRARDATAALSHSASGGSHPEPAERLKTQVLVTQN